MVGFIKLTQKAPPPPTLPPSAGAGDKTKPKLRPFSLGRAQAMARGDPQPPPREPATAAAPGESPPAPERMMMRQTAVGGKRLSSHVSGALASSISQPPQDDQAWHSIKSSKAELKSSPSPRTAATLHPSEATTPGRTPQDPGQAQPHALGLIKIDVVGCRYYPLAVAGQRSQGQEALLVREPDNPHDSNAIKVLLSDGCNPAAGGNQVGHVPKEVAVWLSKLLDSGALTALGYVASAAAKNSGAKSIPLVVRLLKGCERQGVSDGSDDPSTSDMQAAWASLRERIGKDSKKLQAPLGGWLPANLGKAPSAPASARSPLQRPLPSAAGDDSNCLPSVGQKRSSPLSSDPQIGPNVHSTTSPPPSPVKKATLKRTGIISARHSAGSGLAVPPLPHPRGLTALGEVNYRNLLAKASYKPLISTATTPRAAVHGMVLYPLQQILSVSDADVESHSPSVLPSILLKECAEADGEAESDFELLLAIESVSRFEDASITGGRPNAPVTIGSDASAAVGTAVVVDFNPSQSELTIRAVERARSARAKAAHGMVVMSMVCSMGNRGGTGCAGWDASQLRTEAVDAEWLLPPCI